jgi:amidophosphoribosyltransferase
MGMGIALTYNWDKNSDSVPITVGGIHNINHLGQEFFGVTSYDGKMFYPLKKDGLVSEPSIPDVMYGYTSVGNVNKTHDEQPRLNYPASGLPTFAMTFDGYIINREELRDDVRHSDSEIAARIISDSKNFLDGIESLANEIKGYFCLGIITGEGEAYVARSPLGTRTLLLGENEIGSTALSESRAFRKVGVKSYRDLKAGEVVKINEEGVQPLKIIEGDDKKVCSFLWGYTSWVDSIVEGIPVFDVREEAMIPIVERDKERGIEADFATGVEDSGKAYGESYAIHRGIPFRSSVIKYPYFGRSYDRPKETRGNEAVSKVSTVDGKIKGKKIIINDDSIRRGTVTSQGPIDYVWDSGAEEVHMRIGTPRNTKYCRFDDRDVPDITLPANRFQTNEEMARFLKVNSVDFPSLEEYKNAIMRCAKRHGSELREEDLCMGCYEGGDLDFLE